MSPSLLWVCLYGVGLLLELLPVRGGSLTLCFPLFFLLSSADFPAKFSGLLEHLPHFVRVVHDIGSVLIRYSRHVAVDYPHQPVGLLPHSVALAKALLVDIACRILSAEDFPLSM